MNDGVVVVGTGRVARALGYLLHRSGHRVRAVAGRCRYRAEQAGAYIGEEVAALAFDDIPADATRLLIAVSDDGLNETAERISLPSGPGLALHTSGVHGSEVLAALKRKGFRCGALHPLQTVASADQGVRCLPGSTFVFEGDAEAGVWASELVSRLQGHLLKVSAGGRPLYHAAAVMASNYVVGLMAGAVELMGRAGFSERESLQGLGPLTLAAVNNVLTQGPLEALTGPIERGDTATVRRHLQGLEKASAACRELYRAAGRHVLQIAAEKGLSGAKVQEIAELLSGPQEVSLETNPNDRP